MKTSLIRLLTTLGPTAAFDLDQRTTPEVVTISKQSNIAYFGRLDLSRILEGSCGHTSGGAVCDSKDARVRPRKVFLAGSKFHCEPHIDTFTNRSFQGDLA
jgi:hypothetical protein